MTEKGLQVFLRVFFYTGCSFVEQEVAVRLQEIWPHITKVVNYLRINLPPSRQPNSKSFTNVCAAHEDPFIEAKLKYFCYVADIIELYLKKYQTDKPMIPYMYEDLKVMLKKLLSLVVKPEKLEKCKTGTR